MKKMIWLFATVVSLLACSKKSDYPQVIIETGLGNITVELYPDKAPKTVAAFLANVDQKNYDNSSFYRVIKNENLSAEFNRGLIQGGIWKTSPELAQRVPFVEHESPAETGISHTDGTISMARTSAGTAQSEFFICIGDQKKYDSSKATNPDGLGMAAFGKVIKGMDVVRKIQDKPSSAEQFEEDAEIKKMRRKE